VIDDAQMFASLEESGYKRWEIPLLDRGYIYRIIGYPRTDKGELEDPNPVPVDITTHDESVTAAGNKIWQTLRAFGLRDWRIIDILEETAREQQAEMMQQEEDYTKHMQEMVESYGMNYQQFVTGRPDATDPYNGSQVP
jgi:hypothetical protein